MLKETSKQMREQNNRSTQYPLFVIQDKVKVYGSEDMCNEKELKEEYDSDLLCEECSLMDEPEGCDECDQDIFDWFNWEWKFDLRAGVFFTEKACHEHIAQNNYHYHKEVRSYVVGAWRNEEMKEVMQSILKLTDGKIPSQYK